MDNSGKYFAGIDPGKTGGLGVLDAAGRYVAAHRWSEREPVKLYNILLLLRGSVDIVYIEMINAHPGEGLGHVVRNQALIENLGTWKGFCIAAGVPFVLIHPHTWQRASGLWRWQARQKANPVAPSPLSRARHLWPAAPLPCLADDGKAVGLLLAELSRRDHLKGIDRGALQEKSRARAKAKKAHARKLAKLALPLI